MCMCEIMNCTVKESLCKKSKNNLTCAYLRCSHCEIFKKQNLNSYSSFGS
jgi:hypothetical protein